MHLQALELLRDLLGLIVQQVVVRPLPRVAGVLREHRLGVVHDVLALVEHGEARLDGQHQPELARPQVLLIADPGLAATADVCGLLQGN